jgi:hypothetical protein
MLNASGILSFISSSTCFTWDITSHYMNPLKQVFQTLHICISHGMWSLSGNMWDIFHTSSNTGQNSTKERL